MTFIQKIRTFNVDEIDNWSNFYQIAVNQVLLCVKVVQGRRDGFDDAKYLVRRKRFQASKLRVVNSLFRRIILIGK